MSTLTTEPLGVIWMELTDRTLLAALMKQQGVSARQLARKAGWASHSYMNRLLRGEVRNVNAEPAARIAHSLGVPFNLLFVTRVDGDSGRNGRSQGVA